MGAILIAYAVSAGTVVLAEMGDKTQLLAMAFAARYKPSKVLLGVLIATLLNHALAVAAGNIVAKIESAQTLIQCVASLSFIFFGLWTLRGDRLDGEENRKTRFGPVVTVAIGFFIAEMADKTQLATIALAAKFPDAPLWILLGTTTGLLIADAVGIIVGVVLKRKIPERKVKFISAGIFIFFGFLTGGMALYEQSTIPHAAVTILLIALAACTGLIARKLVGKR
ncbi:MAG: TMEM165/GDT1 family protein [Clostridiales Family XIII bacterium]|nr:TMEM165/GDT1 family protein [Clostridiales Family XIII bacterium]